MLGPDTRPPYLSGTDLSGLGIKTAEVIGAIEAMVRGRAEGRVFSTPNAVILPPDGRYLMATFAAMDRPNILACKQVVMNPRNTDRGIEQINGLVSVLDSETGLPLAIMDANWITAVRTAGVSAVVAKRLARPDAAVCALVGAGVQARSHLHAFADCFPLRQVRILGRGRPNIDALSGMVDAMGLEPLVCTTGRAALAGADLVMSAITYSADPKPFLDARDMAPGSFATITDMGDPWLPESLSAFSPIVIDDHSLEASSDKKLVAADLIAGDLADLVLDKARIKAPHGGPAAFLYRSYPLADLALAALAYQKFCAA